MDQCRQNSYANVRRRDLDFDVHDCIYLKIIPMKGIMRFCKMGKLSPFSLGIYYFLGHVCKVDSELESPNEYASAHSILPVFMLKKYVGDLMYIVTLVGLVVNTNLLYEEVLIEVFDWQVKKFTNKEIAYVKVLWRN